MRRASADLRSNSPLPEKKVESNNEVKTSQKTYHEIPPPAPPLRRGSADIRPISPLPDRRAESHFESKVEHKNINELTLPAPTLLHSPLPERKAESTSEVTVTRKPHCSFQNVTKIFNSLHEIFDAFKTTFFAC